jgi:hypothetical protein
LGGRYGYRDGRGRSFPDDVELLSNARHGDQADCFAYAALDTATGSTVDAGQLAEALGDSALIRTSGWRI